MLQSQAGPRKVASTRLFLRGASTGNVFTSDKQICLSAAGKQCDSSTFDPAAEITQLELHYDSNALRPDRYKGQAYVTMESRDQPLVIPIDLSVREGLSVPLLFLAISVALGIANVILLPMLMPLRRRYGQSWSLRTNIERADLPRATEDKLLALTDWSLRATLSNDEATAAAALLTHRLHACEIVARLRRDGSPPPAVATALVQLEALALTPTTTDADLSTAETAVHDAIKAHVADTTAAPHSELMLAYSPIWLRKEVAKARRLSTKVWSKVPLGALGLLLDATVTAVFSGVVLLVILAIGVRENYLGNTTFGAERLKDYLGLVTWGLAAWAAQGALLVSGRAKTPDTPAPPAG